jgi:hypothetical protein
VKEVDQVLGTKEADANNTNGFQLDENSRSKVSYSGIKDKGSFLTL